MASKIPNHTKIPAMFAAYSDYESDWTGEYAYMIGSEVTKADKIPAGLAVVRIPAQTYGLYGNRANAGCAPWSLDVG
jgi:predicted transcriptional regulator YdeE